MRFTRPKFVTATVNGEKRDDVVRVQLGTPSMGRRGLSEEDGHGSLLFTIEGDFDHAPDIEIAADNIGGLLLCQLRQYDVNIQGSSRCRICGCTENHGCRPACSWAEPDLCSRCVA